MWYSYKLGLIVNKLYILSKLIFTIPISLIAKLILLSMGWSLISPRIFNKLKKYNKTVLVFSHTSYADFYIFLLYMFAYPQHLFYVKTLIKPQPFKYAGFLLKSLGGIPSTKIDEKNGGSVIRISNELKKYKRWIFLISPKGSILKREWRTGYYNIGKITESHFRVAGLDYEKKNIFLSKSYDSSNSEESLRKELYKELEKIVPLFPDGEIVEIREHNEKYRNIINISNIIIIIGLSLSITTIMLY